MTDAVGVVGDVVTNCCAALLQKSRWEAGSMTGGRSSDDGFVIKGLVTMADSDDDRAGTGFIWAECGGTFQKSRSEAGSTGSGSCDGLMMGTAVASDDDRIGTETEERTKGFVVEAESVGLFQKSRYEAGSTAGGSSDKGAGSDGASDVVVGVVNVDKDVGLFQKSL